MTQSNDMTMKAEEIAPRALRCLASGHDVHVYWLDTQVAPIEIGSDGSMIVSDVRYSAEGPGGDHVECLDCGYDETVEELHFA